MAAPPSSSPPRKTFEQRARPVPYRFPYIVSVSLSCVYYLCIVGAIGTLISLLIEPNLIIGIVLAAFVFLGGIFWLLSYLKRRNATCPLCKGTPLLDTWAHKHEKAVRFFPLNYGTTNTIRIIARQQFRCHFCGTPFDLLKEIKKTPPQTPPAEAPRHDEISRTTPAPSPHPPLSSPAA